MTKLRTVIADDERPAREYLKAILASFDEIEIVGVAENGTDAVALIERTKPDLAFLDLKMPELTGLEVVRMIKRSCMPLVAFVTAYDEFAVAAFELNAVDYLLKPVERSRVSETIARSNERLEKADWKEQQVERLERSSETIEEHVPPTLLTRIPVRKRDEITLLAIADVISITADGELLHLVTKDKQRYSINHRLKDIETRLDAELFVRLSRSVIVNVASINRILPMPGGTYDVELSNGQTITSSRLQSRILRSRLLKL